jgi:hypothetical protein
MLRSEVYRQDTADIKLSISAICRPPKNYSLFAFILYFSLGSLTLPRQPPASLLSFIFNFLVHGRAVFEISNGLSDLPK